jgi:23S rRNA (guanosine2251-2'-O)-methyltransferase
MYLYGKNALSELLRSNQVSILKKVFLSPASEVSARESDMLRSCNVQVSVIPLKTIEQLVGKDASHQGVVVEIKDFQYTDYEEWLGKTEERIQTSVVFLDQVQDPHNVGAIIRTAYAAGMGAIVLCQDNSALITPAVIKVSSGSAFLIPVCVVNNLKRALQQAKEKGFWVYGTERNGVPYPKVVFPNKTALVLGNEGSGIRRLVRENCDEMIAIPMANSFDSLNVSVSAGILCFEIFRQKEYPDAFEKNAGKT